MHSCSCLGVDGGLLIQVLYKTSIFDEVSLYCFHLGELLIVFTLFGVDAHLV